MKTQTLLWFLPFNLLLMVGGILSVAHNVKAASEPRPRFEVVYSETINNPIHVIDGTIQPSTETFTIFHDKESGIEIVCTLIGDARDYYISGSNSCFPTGRKW